MENKIDTVCFVGAGAMGCFNALLAAMSGHRAVLHDVSADTLAAAPATIKEIIGHMAAARLIDPEKALASMSNISYSADLTEACAHADLISESVPENVDLKRKVHAEIERACRPDAIITTNTSSLLPSDIDCALENGERFAALHSHLGAMLFDIVGGPRTSDDTITALKNYVIGIGGAPLVLVKENRGYVFNAINGAILTTSMMLVIKNTASIHEVDHAWIQRTGSPMGPFGMMDMFGISLILDGWRNNPKTPAAQAIRDVVVKFLSGYVDAGKLGMKTGEGFYTYPDPAYAADNFLTGDAVSAAADYALTSAWLQNAIAVAANGIAPEAEVDNAWIAATRQQKGPFAMLDEIGMDQMIAMIAATGPLAGPENEGAIDTYLRQRNKSAAPAAAE